MDMNRTRGGQYIVSLRRDVITDNLDLVLNAPCFIEKGWLPYNNPLIFNEEAINTNQIKYRESLLKDKTKLAWVCGYYSALDGNNNQTELSGSFTIHEQDVFETVNDITTWSYYNLLGHDLYPLQQFDNINVFKPAICTYTESPSLVYNSIDVTPLPQVIVKETSTINNGTKYYFTSNKLSNGRLLSYDFEDWWGEHYTSSSTRSKKASALGISSSYQLTTSQQNTILGYDSKIIYDSNSQFYYRVTIDKQYSDGYRYINTGDLRTDLINYANSSIYLSTYGDLQVPNYDYSFRAYFTDLQKITIKLTILGTVSPDSEFNYNNRIQGPGTDTTISYKYTIDAPYNMFCIPYSPTHEKFKVKIDSFTFDVDPDINDNFIYSIPRNNTQKIFDVQLLPYCPLPIRSQSGQEGIYWDSVNSLLDCTYLLDSSAKSANYTHFFAHYGNRSSFTTSTIRAIAINCDKTSFKGTITDTETSSIITDPISRKLNVMTEFKRLCSPNYSSVFEFNAQKNDGISYWEYNCTYKPYTPYIHVNPNWGGLYRRDFNDNRGLICAGQFSMPRTTDQFAQYELQNKNYQLSFQRSIEMQEMRNSWQIKEMQFNILADAVGGMGDVASGAIVGTAIAGPAGGIAGALSGGLKTVAKTVGGTFDVLNQNERNRQEIKYQKDQWGYNLENIKALPQTLTNTSSFDINNKIFPFVESYMCTTEEYNACAEKIKYNGMTVGVIGTIDDYRNRDDQCYIKGDLIRIRTGNGVKSLDTHMANEISNEIYKGVFI